MQLPATLFFRSLIAALRSHQVKRDRHHHRPSHYAPPTEDGKQKGKKSGKTDRNYNTRFVWLPPFLPLSRSLSFFTCFLPFSLNLFTICLVCLFDILPCLVSLLPLILPSSVPPPAPLHFGSDLLQSCATAWKMFQVHFYERSLILWQEAEGVEEFVVRAAILNSGN